MLWYKFMHLCKVANIDQYLQDNNQLQATEHNLHAISVHRKHLYD